MFEFTVFSIVRIVFKKAVIHVYVEKICSFLLLIITHFLSCISIYGILLAIVLMGFRPRKRVNR